MIEVFYFFLFQVVAINMAFMPAHLRALGLSGREISTVSAVSPVLALVVPLCWAWLADRTHRHDRILRVVSLGAFAGFTPVVFARSFRGALVGYFGYALFAVAMGGLADALALARVRTGAIYGRLRLWGSVGFVTAAVAGGTALTLRGPQAAASMIPPLAMWLALAATFLAALGLRGTGEAAVHPRLADIKTLLGDRRLRLVLAVGSLHWICMAPYNVYFGIFLRDLGLAPVSWGLAYSVGVVAEVLVLLWFHRLQVRFSLDTLLAAAFVASALRWLAVAAVRAPALLIALQVLHGMTFGLFWSAAIALVGATVPPSLRATGQALLVMSINLGGALGNAVTGRLYDASGPRVLFLVAALGELLPLAVVLRGRRTLRG